MRIHATGTLIFIIMMSKAISRLCILKDEVSFIDTLSKS